MTHKKIHPAGGMAVGSHARIELQSYYGVYTIMTGVIYFGRYRLRLGKGTVIAVSVSFATGVAAVAAAWRGWLIL